MNIFISFILAIVSSMLIDNVVLSRFYGICPFLGVSKKVSSSFGMGIAVVFVIVMACIKFCALILARLLIITMIIFSAI